MFRGGRGARGNSRGSSVGGRGRGRGGRGRSNGRQATQQRGLFADGIWHCDCKPRLPAEHFKVKKEGPNTGRWFYTCQQHEQQRCAFFLWDEDAKPREESAVLNNSRMEPRRDSTQDGWNAGREPKQQPEQPKGKGLFSKIVSVKMENDESTDSGSPDSSSETLKAVPNGSKRKAQEAMLDDDDDDDDDDEWGVNQSDDEEIAKATDKALFQTPAKAQKTGIYATPATTVKRKLPWLEQPATPSAMTNQSQSYFDSPSKQQPNSLHQPQTPIGQPSIAAATTPSPPTRHRDAFVNPADATSILTTEALSALSGVHIPSEALLNLRSILSKHDLRSQGVIKGRDISRLALKAKDAKIAELQARIVSLEADREVERAVSNMRRRRDAEGRTG